MTALLSDPGQPRGSGGQRGKLIACLSALAIGAGGYFAFHYLVPRPAPAMEVQAIDGDTVSLERLRGSVALINFWSTSCEICLREMPRLAQMHQRFAPRGLTTVAVAMSHDPPNRVVDYARRAQLPFKVALDIPGDAARAFAVRGTPTTVLIDRQGRVAARIVGEPDFGRLHDLIEAKLRER